MNMINNDILPNNCCYARGGFYKVIVVGNIIYCIATWYLYLYCFVHEADDYWLMLVLEIFLIFSLIYLLLKYKNYRVYVKDNKVIYINWRNKESVYDMKELKDISIEGGKGLSLIFPPKKRVTIWWYYLNFANVRDEIAEAFKNTRNNVNGNDSNLI